MKKVFLIVFLSFVFMLNAAAENFPDLKYKNIGKKEKISYDSQSGVWSKKIDKKSGNYFIKTKGFGDFYDYLDADKNYAFSTNCEYEFIYNNELIGYSNKDLNFYSISYTNGKITKQALPKETIEEMFPDYKIIALSEFSPNTNCVKIKKHLGDLNIILFNDIGKTFENYAFFSGNAKIRQYDLRGFLTVQKSGMIQFSRLGEQDYKFLYVILVR